MRKCDGCQKTYHRVNKIRVWTVRNIGHRVGWENADMRLCIKCLSDKTAQRIVTIGSVNHSLQAVH